MRLRRFRSAIVCVLAVAAMEWRKADQELEVEMLRDDRLVSFPVPEDES